MTVQVGIATIKVRLKHKHLDYSTIKHFFNQFFDVEVRPFI